MYIYVRSYSYLDLFELCSFRGLHAELQSVFCILLFFGASRSFVTSQKKSVHIPIHTISVVAMSPRFQVLKCHPNRSGCCAMQRPRPCASS